jgi:oligoendopeptidase F
MFVGINPSCYTLNFCYIHRLNNFEILRPDIVGKTTGAEQVRWDLSDLYPALDSESFDKDKKHVEELVDQFRDTFRGRIAELTAAELKQALELEAEIQDLAMKLFAFVYLSWTTNTTDPEWGKALAAMNEFASEMNQQLVFFGVEWLSVDDDKANELINSDELEKYRYHLQESRKRKPYILSEDEEKILSAKSTTGNSAWNRFFDETLGKATFQLDGEELSEQEALSKLHEPDRELRKRAAESLTKTFGELSHPLTFIFNTILLDKATNDKLRGYPDWITSRNLSNQIEQETVDTLISTVTESYPLVQRYYKLKKELLGYEELFDYDRYAPILDSQEQISWDEAKSAVVESYTEFHPRMGEIVEKFFDKNWIDAAPAKGKRGGAYSASTATSVHPYVFMNYMGKVRDVQTLAHELGHGVHQYLSKKQGPLMSDTPLTTAETASVFGEMLVFQKLKKQLTDPKEKLALLIGKIDDTIATVYRQVAMNRFENAIHNARREEGELTSDRFAELWMETQRDLYGDSVTLSEDYGRWWSYIPHFLHSPGYVYAYSFGELLVLALYELYEEGYDGFKEHYAGLLEAGGSDRPENLIGCFGLDIQSPDFWKKGISVMEKMMDEAEELAKEIGEVK